MDPLIGLCVLAASLVRKKTPWPLLNRSEESGNAATSRFLFVDLPC